MLHELPKPRKAMLHLAECDQDLLAIARDGFVEGCLRALVIRPVATAREDRQREARPNGPGAALPVEQGVDVAAHVTAGACQTQHREERGFGDADAGIGCGKLTFRFSNVRSAL